MSYRDEVTKLYNQGEYLACAELAQTTLVENPSDIRLADLLHRANKKIHEAQLHFSNQWFPTWQNTWVDAFARLGWDRMKTHQVIEIGAFEGQCTSWLTDVLLGGDNSRVVVVDPFTGSMEHDTDNPALNPKMGIDAFIACYFSEIKLIPWGQSYQMFIIKK